MDIKGRNALVTGGARRVGRELTMSLAEAGAGVFIHYNNAADAADETRADVAALGRRAGIGAADLSQPMSAASLMEAASEAIGPVSILVNNASGFPKDRLENVTLDGWQRAHNLTLASSVFLTQAFAAALPEDMDGAVVNLTDVKTTKPYREHFSYIVAKGGLDTFTRAAALALAPRIRVNAVALGVILPPPGEDYEYAQRLVTRVPLQGAGGPGPVAAAVVALVENDFVTGEIIRVDGGAHLK